jgi:hypothetical protein
LLASRLVASCDKSASILPRTVAKHISSERIVTPELAPDDHVGLIDSCDHTHSRERFPTSASGLERQTTMLCGQQQLDRKDNAIRTAQLSGFGLRPRTPW